eukprot:TRINITY_DN12062_c0_g1_i1.p1 TRINITY_DN12062_c0_g1~~TRINITY_DN12062_c0_g1_i1.p1  ORF type:complete len:225 (-),score=54.19 TRINITY_DN12062_c0_g1_i1:101-775(-)
MFLLRLHNQEDVSHLVLRSCPSYDSLLTMLHNLFGLPASKIEYQDEEGDRVLITTNVELEEAVRIVKSTGRTEEGKTVLELFIGSDHHQDSLSIKQEQEQPQGLPTKPESPEDLHTSPVLLAPELQAAMVTKSESQVLAIEPNSEAPVVKDDGLELDWVISPGPKEPLVSSMQASQLPQNAAEIDLRLLSEMGFVDNKQNLKLLLNHKGDIEAVVDALLSQSRC